MKSRGEMSEHDLLAVIAHEEKRALGGPGGELSSAREQALRYYNSEPYGDEVEGRSQIVTSEVADTVEWILPSLMKIFTTSDDAVEFQAQTARDVPGAKQATQTCNYVFYRQNAGFIILYSFFKDALIQKNGYAKVHYEKGYRKGKEQYAALTDAEFQMLVSAEEIEVVAHSAYPAEGAYAMAAPSMLHDVIVEIQTEYGKVCIDPVPPEEMRISPDHTEVDLQKCPFTAQVRKVTISKLREMGFDDGAIDQLGSEDEDVESSGEYQARHALDDESIGTDDGAAHESMREVWVTEAYIQVDYDGDGVAELRKVTKSGSIILDNEEAEIVPFAAITPTINTHRHSGKSVAECVMELQLIKSTLTRQVLNNIYLTNAPRNAVLTSPNGEPQANLDDLMVVRPGGVVREFQSGAVRPLEVPFMAQHGLSVMQYIDTVQENRTGVTKYNQGLDADSLNQTARGITQIMTASQQRIELIARIFAETGVKQIFKLILHCLTKYNSKPMTIRLTDQYIDVDPRTWSTGMDMVVNVGLGTGNKDQQLVHLNAIAQAQWAALQAGLPLVTPKEMYNTQAKIAENAGFKNVGDFWIDPSKAPPQQPKGPPPQVQAEMLKGNIMMQLEDKRIQRDMALKNIDASVQRANKQDELTVQQQNDQRDAQRTLLEARLDAEAAARERQHETMLEMMRQQEARHKTDLDANVKLIIAGQQRQAAGLKGAPVLDENGEVAPHPLESAMVAMTQAVQSLIDVHSSPKTIVRGPDGRAVGVQYVGANGELVQKTITRGPDGRAAGVQ